MGILPRGTWQTLTFLTWLLSATTVGAQSTVIKDQLPGGAKRIRVSTTLSTESTLHEPGSVDHFAESRLTVAPAFLLNAKQQVRTSLALIQQHGAIQKSAISNLKITWSHSPLNISERVSWIPQAGGSLPTNEDDQRHNSFQGSVFIEPIIMVNWSRWALYWTPTAVKNIHGYTRNHNSVANISHSLSNALTLEWTRKSLSLGVTAGYIMGWTYQDNLRDQFILDQSVTYAVDKQWTLILGHSNSGDMLKSNGRDRNVSFFDENSSTVYAAIKTTL